MLQTADDFMRRFTFADETSNKPITPRLKRDELGINVFPTVHAELVNRTPVLSESAKRRQERQVRIVHCFVQHDKDTCMQAKNNHTEEIGKLTLIYN